MQRRPPFSLGKRIVVGGLAVVLGWVLLTVFLPRALDGQQYHSLSTRLGDIEQGLAVVLDRTTGRSGVPETPERWERGVELMDPGPASLTRSALGAPGPDNGAVLDRLEAIVGALERLEASIALQTRRLETRAADAVEPPRLTALQELTPEMDVQRVLELGSSWNADPKTARRSLQLLTRAEVIERFGPPTVVTGGYWEYHVPMTDPSLGQHVLVINWVDGYTSNADYNDEWF